MSISKNGSGSFEPLLKIGVISDIHVSSDATTEPFRQALEYFRSQQVDGVAVAGDLADWGFAEQLEKVGKVWDAVFPGNTGLGGHRVEKLFIYGNHDIDAINYGGVKSLFPDERARNARAIAPVREKLWERVFGEPYAPICVKTIKGYAFVLAHFTSANDTHGLREFMENLRPSLDSQKPFFYVQHCHLRDTVYGRWPDPACDGGEATKILRAFPNAVAFSGHSHYSLTDERSIWQEEFTSIGTGALSYIMTFGGRENSCGCFKPLYGVPRIYPLDPADGAQGLLMSLYKDRIVFARRQFCPNASLGDDWVVPLDGSRPFRFETRKAASRAPEFKPGDEAHAVYTDPDLSTPWNGDEPRVLVSFPPVERATSGTRAYDYEVAAEIKAWDVNAICITKRIYSGGYYRDESHDRADVVCPFALSELPPHGDIRFIVRPADSFGNHGEAIVSDYLTLPTTTSHSLTCK